MWGSAQNLQQQKKFCVCMWRHKVAHYNLFSRRVACCWECSIFSICSAGTPAAADKGRGGVHLLKCTHIHTCARTRAHTHTHTHTPVNESLSSGEYSLSAMSRSSSLRESEAEALLTADFIGHLHGRGAKINLHPSVHPAMSLWLFLAFFIAFVRSFVCWFVLSCFL